MYDSYVFADTVISSAINGCSSGSMGISVISNVYFFCCNYADIRVNITVFETKKNILWQEYEISTEGLFVLLHSTSLHNTWIEFEFTTFHTDQVKYTYMKFIAFVYFTDRFNFNRHDKYFINFSDDWLLKVMNIICDKNSIMSHISTETCKSTI